MMFESSNLDSLRKVYVNQLRTLLSAEQQITEALPKMIEKATDPQLKQAFQSHLQETHTHESRLEQILQSTDERKPIKCKVINTMIDEAESMIKDAGYQSVRDVVLIAAGQQIEHYEIATYGTVRRFAQILGYADHAQLLDLTIQEEGHADHLLTEIADRVNPAARRAA